MRVRVNVAGNIKIYHGSNVRDVQTTRGNVRGDQDVELLLLELVNDLISLVLV